MIDTTTSSSISVKARATGAARFRIEKGTFFGIHCPTPKIRENQKWVSTSGFVGKPHHRIDEPEVQTQQVGV